MEINVLWFDDEHETLEIIKNDAYREGINLIGVLSADEGIELLKNNSNQFDAVLLDGKFYKGLDQIGHIDPKEMNDQAFGIVAKELGYLKAKGTILPWFILSGQPSFVKERNSLVDVFKDSEFANGKVFDKNQPKDFIELFEIINSSVQNIDKTRIKGKYARLFELCSEKYLGENNFDRLLHLLLFLEGEEVYNEEKFNSIRKLFEAVLYGCYRNGLVDERCKTDRGLNMTWSLYYLKGSSTSVKLKDGSVNIQGPIRMPEIISESAFEIKEITSAGSHYEDEHPSANTEHSEISNLKKHVDNPFIIKSLIYKLLDFLLWYKTLVDKNIDIESNKSKCKVVDHSNGIGNWVAGIVKKESQTAMKFYPNEGGAWLWISKKVKEENGLVGGEEVNAFIVKQDIIKDVKDPE